jgi:predicted NBD/HSP70 family sugar kinase
MPRETSYCFAVDLDGTKLSAAMADALGQIVVELDEPTDPRGAAYVAEQITSCADKLARSAGIEVGQARHVVVGIPGKIDPGTGRVSLASSIVGPQEFDLLRYLRSRFGPHVAIENAGSLAMLGEQALGCAGQCRNAAFLALGPGLEIGLLIDDKLFRGTRGAAGGISDLALGCDPTSPRSGATGPLELEVGSLAIVDRYRRYQGETGALGVRDIFRLLGEGDPVAASVLDTAARWVALAVVTVQSLLDLELIVLGGNIGMRPGLYDRVRRAVARLFSRPITIAPSRLGDRAALIGAVCAATQAMHPGATA